MAKKCIYCKCSIDDGSVIDFCDKCGHAVWGHKMLNAIKTSMRASAERGDLMQGSVA